MPYTILCIIFLVLFSGCYGAEKHDEVQQAPNASDERAPIAPVARWASEDPNKARVPLNGVRFVPLEDANAHILGKIDPNAFLEATFQNPNYFRKPVPRLIHRILTAEEALGQWDDFEAWETYAKANDFKLIQWRNADLDAYCAALDPNLFAAIKLTRSRGRDDVAAHLAGLAVLRGNGGIWIGSQVTPPRIDGSYVDFARIISMQGLTFATNHRARRVGGWSIYITTSLMAAAQDHPWVSLAAKGASDNTLNLFESGHDAWPARYYAGNTYLSRNLGGVFSAIPFTYLSDLNVFPKDIIVSAEDALE